MGDRPRRPPDRSSRSGSLRERRERRGHRVSSRPSLVCERSLSTTLDYALSLAIATVLITGLFVAAGDFVGNQRETVVRTELRVIGERITADVAAADRLVVAGEGSTTAVVNQSLPRQVTGVPYRVTVDVNDGDQWLNLSTTSPAVSVAVRFDTDTPVAERTVTGGDVSVVYTGSDLEVRS